MIGLRAWAFERSYDWGKEMVSPDGKSLLIFSFSLIKIIHCPPFRTSRRLSINSWPTGITDYYYSSYNPLLAFKHVEEKPYTTSVTTRLLFSQAIDEARQTTYTWYNTLERTIFLMVNSINYEVNHKLSQPCSFFWIYSFFIIPRNLFPYISALYILVVCETSVQIHQF